MKYEVHVNGVPVQRLRTIKGKETLSIGGLTLPLSTVTTTTIFWTCKQAQNTADKFKGEVVKLNN